MFNDKLLGSNGLYVWHVIQTWVQLFMSRLNELGVVLWLQRSSAEHTRQLGNILATCSDSLRLLPKTSCELSAGSTGSSLLFLVLLECCFSALLFCLLFTLVMLGNLCLAWLLIVRITTRPLRPVTCCWTVVEKSHDKVNNKLPAGDL